MAEELARFTREIAHLRLPQALSRYHQALETLLQTSLDELLQGREPVCGQGCDACCHQPLVLSLVELAGIYFEDETRLGGEAFQARIQDELATLERWRGEGAQTPPELARKQWAEGRPCLLLQGGACSVHPARPDICRNAFAEERCTPDSLNTFGFGNTRRTAWRPNPARARPSPCAWCACRGGSGSLSCLPARSATPPSSPGRP